LSSDSDGLENEGFRAQHSTAQGMEFESPLTDQVRAGPFRAGIAIGCAGLWPVYAYLVAGAVSANEPQLRLGWGFGVC
jgi:hypothetical protein